MEVQQFLAGASLLRGRQRPVKVLHQLIAIRRSPCNGEIASSEIFVTQRFFRRHAGSRHSIGKLRVSMCAYFGFGSYSARRRA
jgi:hypothetical protein